MKGLVDCLAVGAGGFAGSIARYLVASICGRMFATSFPVGTLVINLSGSLFLGWFATVAGTRMMISPTTRLAIAVGFVGAYTTFSTWMFESDALVRKGAGIQATLNLIGSLMLGLIAVRAGVWLAER